MIILLHTSKTMRSVSDSKSKAVQQPVLLSRANELAKYLKKLTPAQIQKVMAVSAAMAEKTYDMLQTWNENGATLPALDIFLGDIYSGLQVQNFTEADRAYANEHLFILSGLYGVLRPIDEIQPYRLEMGYKLPGPEVTSLYTFWGDSIAKQLPAREVIMNLSAVEYTKAVLPYLKDAVVIAPKFLTISPKTGEPTFVTVHAKIARGAFASWLIRERIEETSRLKEFNDIGYTYSEELSTDSEPVFVAQEFQGIGLSVRLT